MAKIKKTKLEQTAPKVRDLFDDTPVCTYLVLCGELAKRNLLLRQLKLTKVKREQRPVVLEPSRAIRILRQVDYNTQPNAKSADLLTLRAYGLITLVPFRPKLTAIGKLLLRNTNHMSQERLIYGSDKTEERNRD